jgi:hypothetical protein
MPPSSDIDSFDEGTLPHLTPYKQNCSFRKVYPIQHTSQATVFEDIESFKGENVTLAGGDSIPFSTLQLLSLPPITTPLGSYFPHSKPISQPITPKTKIRIDSTGVQTKSIYSPFEQTYRCGSQIENNLFLVTIDPDSLNNLANIEPDTSYDGNCDKK